MKYNSKEKISVIGAGSWGTTLSIILSRRKRAVTLSSVFDEHNRIMRRERENKCFLKDVKFPASLAVAPSLSCALQNRIITIAVPAKYVRALALEIRKKDINLKDKVFVSVSKGIEASSLKRVSEILKEELGNVKVAVLSGPNIAKEVLVGVPSAAVIASADAACARYLQTLFTTPAFRVYTHKDVCGVELGGALKNVIAIACGIADGLGFGTNTKSALLTRGLVEITRLAKKLGARPETFWGISGLGDLATTCFSPHSRNRFVGESVGRGRSIKEVLIKMDMVAEGTETVKSAYHLSRKLNIEMPITQEVYKVLYRRKSPARAVSDLMNRALKSEEIR